MKIELKRMQYYARQSQETIAFNADLYINGKKVGEASNHGHGGPTDYGSYTDEGKKAIEEAEAYCKGLPGETYTLGGKTRTLEMSLESFINDIVGDFVNQKELQKFRNLVERRCKDSLVIGKPDKEIIAEYQYKITILQILCKPRGSESITNALQKDVIPLLKDGYMLLNTNIPENILKSAGLVKGQYVTKQGQDLKASTNKQQKGKGKSI